MELLFASAARTASASSADYDGSRAKSAVFFVDVTALSGTPTLDIYMQWTPDGGTTWIDFAHFAQITTQPVQRQLKWSRDAAVTTAEEAIQSEGLAAGSVKHGPVGGTWRARGVIGGGSPSITFSLRVRQTLDRS